mmetsp:Transcript_17741/g.30390  ORF Transcript_17741/g.30390 Transcript_17741/m.30390 type:complete len:152 (-) Transcript_17741:460-915(-)|eukprot:CAMPEP_0119102594 /NCGR_PEP_ID=MMETSP1180-20130426/1293_1 /TAXON_ID=3052 ORGANISM="Chlamydomonas cf sp, Strain CCMP681" /NCGR_SAMPLE_ID=MMETSP1180 /ASSEMBLY_ACC=CAM_ASM_000741 /LENGTH=151 /DNA_ID=CAMNT_0007086911 /DNA_START=51 /DNA_END=506 /DNA_ORIENTATION=-
MDDAAYAAPTRAQRMQLYSAKQQRLSSWHAQLSEQLKQYTAVSTHWLKEFVNVVQDSDVLFVLPHLELVNKLAKELRATTTNYDNAVAAYEASFEREMQRRAEADQEATCVAQEHPQLLDTLAAGKSQPGHVSRATRRPVCITLSLAATQQ